MDRKAIVAGHFYPKTQESLKKNLEQLIDKTQVTKDALAVIMPHAGYSYSGAIAGKTISQIKVKDTAIILGPNHTGLGMPYSLVNEGTWTTPLGKIKINQELADLLLANSEHIKNDETSHVYEHSIEVELPFLQYLNNAINIVPMIISDFNIKYLQIVGEQIAKAIKTYSQPTLIVASTDMTHYEPHDQAKEKDLKAIDAILELDPKKLHSVVTENKISMCGLAPVTTTLFACKALGATKAELIGYTTSGELSGDYDNVVGYAGIVIK
ncbi:MAG: AmmeMemoRadiSam system protein B [PVC group bacterium]|nr:AmmeMemoRadiSam system protein B [PVC group bacterium]